MADPGAEDQGHAPDLRPGGGGHDQPRGPARGWHPSQPPHQIQRQPHLCKSEMSSI